MVAYGVSVTCCVVGGNVGDGVGGTVSFEMALMRGAAASEVGDDVVGDGIGDVSSEMALGDGFGK